MRCDQCEKIKKLIEEDSKRQEDRSLEILQSKRGSARGRSAEVRWMELKADSALLCRIKEVISNQP